MTELEKETKTYKRQLTNSGDYYCATDDLWKKYWAAVQRDDWDFVLSLETGQNPEFYYDP